MDNPYCDYDLYLSSLEPTRSQGINYSTAIMLINKNIRAVSIIYDNEKEKPNQTRYTFKTLDKSIKVDDLVVIPTDTRHGYTVVKVVGVDVPVDYDNSTQIKWIVSKADIEADTKIRAEEEKWIAQLKASEERKKRKEMEKNLREMYDDADLEGSLIATIQDNSLLSLEDKSSGEKAKKTS